MNKWETYQTFPDGWGTSWKVNDRKLEKIKQQVIHFENQSVGERRYWDAYVSGVEITRAIRVPYQSEVNQGDIMIINGEQYLVVQKDLKTDRMPSSWLLSLTETPIEYREAEDGNRD